jgi:hypothetical protein
MIVVKEGFMMISGFISLNHWLQAILLFPNEIADCSDL